MNRFMPKHRSKKKRLSDDLVGRLIQAQERVAVLEAGALSAIKHLPGDPGLAEELLRKAVFSAQESPT